MADRLKVLGQVALASGVLTDVYAPGAATQAVVSTLVVCNKGTGGSSFRISVAPNGAADDPSHYIYYNVGISETETFATTIGITLGAFDTIRAWASTPDISISIFGTEIV